MTLAERMKKLRKQYNLSQKKLASLMNVSYATVNRVENNRHKPIPLFLSRFEELEYFFRKEKERGH